MSVKIVKIENFVSPADQAIDSNVKPVVTEGGFGKRLSSRLIQNAQRGELPEIVAIEALKNEAAILDGDDEQALVPHPF